MFAPRFTPEDDAFRAELQDWLAAHLARRAALPEEEAARREMQRAWQRELAAGGWVGIQWPRTYGGREATLEQQIIYGLPDTYYAQYVKNIQSVTSAAAQKAAATYIQPPRFLVLVVGDRKIIEPGIRALNLGPVRALSVTEALGE